MPSSHALARPPPDFAHVIEQESIREDLKQYDQLSIVRDHNSRAFFSFREGDFWKFKCSYKYKLGEVDTYEYVGSEKIYYDRRSS